MNKLSETLHFNLNKINKEIEETENKLVRMTTTFILDTSATELAAKLSQLKKERDEITKQIAELEV